MPFLNVKSIRELALECGAADAGVVSIDHPMLDEERAEIVRSFPQVKSVISIVCRMNSNSVRAPQRSVSNHEFHHTGYETDEVCRNLAHRLLEMGVSAMNEPMAFPMEYADFPGKSWIISHKKVAVAAGLGHMGIHRNVIHPKFGNFILLGSVLIDQEVKEIKSEPLDFNPCLECKLCVAACPVGAIHSDGYFNFSACMTHNYREFMGGFVDWVHAITNSPNMKSYKKKFNDSETVNLWQSLSYGPNYKAAYCLAVCPAGEDVIGPFSSNKKEFIDSVMKPLIEKKETIYAVKGSDAEDHARKRFPNKTVKTVGNRLSPKTIQGFVSGSKLIFQPGKARGIKSRIHFRFLESELKFFTYVIENQKLEIFSGLVGKPDLTIEASSESWLKFINKEQSLFLSLLTRKIRPKGKITDFIQFGRIFPT